MAPIPIIHDGDHGGDDFIATLLLLAYPELFNLLGIMTVSGNTNAKQAAYNAATAVALAKKYCRRHDIGDVPIHSGALQSLEMGYRLSDDAFGQDGLGSVQFKGIDESSISSLHSTEEQQDALIWLCHTLKSAAEPVSICVTGPGTNIARLITDHSDLTHKIKQIIIMGGGINPSGNVRPYAEFNFYMDPHAADIIIQSGINTVLHSLDSTHQVVYTKARQKAFQKLNIAHKQELNAILRLTEDLEKKSFDAEGAFPHDSQTVYYLANPENYELEAVQARVLKDRDEDEKGRLVLSPSSDSSLKIVRHNKNPDMFFDFLFEGMHRLFNRDGNEI